jgi:hypothetical protein
LQAAVATEQRRVNHRADMTLDDGQRKQVSEWVEQGLKLSEIQSRISKEFNLSMTYMDVRFLIDDLKLKLKDLQPTTPVTLGAPGQPPGKAPAKSVPPAASPAPGTPAPAGSVSVVVDQIARPGAVVSGRVTFSDGKGAAWLIDQMGRPGLIPDQQGYRPSQTDIAEFQTQLQDELARMGF